MSNRIASASDEVPWKDEILKKVLDSVPSADKAFVRKNALCETICAANVIFSTAHGTSRARESIYCWLCPRNRSAERGAMQREQTVTITSRNDWSIPVEIQPRANYITTGARCYLYRVVFQYGRAVKSSMTYSVTWSRASYRANSERVIVTLSHSMIRVHI